MQGPVKPWYPFACLLLSLASFGLAATHTIRWLQRGETPLENGLEGLMWIIFGVGWMIRFLQRNKPQQ